MRKRNVVAIAAVSAFLVVGAGAAAAFASIPDSNGVIHACYQDPPPAHGAPLNVIDSGNGGSCGGGHTEVSWYQAGGDGMVTEESSVFVPTGQQPGATAQVDAACPSGYAVSGGGYGMGMINQYEPTEKWVVFENFNSPGSNQWDVLAEMTGTPYAAGGGWSLIAYVNCLPVSA